MEIPQPASQQGDPEQQCIFCQIIEGAVPSMKIYEDEAVLAILDIKPAAPGHLLIIPKQHVMVMPQLQPEAVAHLGQVAKNLSKALLQVFRCQGTTLFIANGAAAGQRAPHFLMHLIPRFIDDGLEFQLEEQEVQEEFLHKLMRRLGGEPQQTPPKETKQEEEIAEEPPLPTWKEGAKPNKDDGANAPEGAKEGAGDGVDLDLVDKLFG